MSVNEELKADVAAAAQGKPEASPVQLIRRDDDVELSDYVAGDLDEKKAPCVYATGAFWKYQVPTGVWEELDHEYVRLHVMSYSGRPHFAGLKKNEETGETTTLTKRLRMSNGRVDGVMRCTQTRLHRAAFWDDAKPGIAFRNGFVTVDVREGFVVSGHQPENRARVAMDHAFRDDHACARWKLFLTEVFHGDDDAEQKTAALQEFLGLCLIGRITPFDKCFLLLGDGANGKSVFLDLVRSLFPRDAVASIPPQDWTEHYHIAELDGVRLNVVSEVPQDRDLMGSAVFNAVITGDLVHARRPAERPFDFTPVAGHLFAANSLPMATDFKRGFWRRWVLLAFNRNFEKDPGRELKHTLLAKLREESPGIMRWAMDGALRALRNGSITPVPSSEQLLSQWRLDSDQVAGFVQDRCEATKAEERMAQPSDLYRDYRAWCALVGHKHPLTMARFCSRLTALGYPPVDIGAFKVRALLLKAKPSSSGPPDDAGDGW